jgi:NAD(P)-dependent dehydrogenase (short-subunit alcohol dehydrogenase family)
MNESKRVFITGASSGFGFGAAKALAGKGHRVFASMRAVDGKNADKAAELRRWADTEKRDLDVIDCDVARDESVVRAVASAIDRAGAIDVLINNAGVGTWGLQEAFTPDQVKALFDVNVIGMLRMNRAVLPHMRKARAGYVIYVSSGLGRILFPFLGPYTATKHAVEAIAEIGSYEIKLHGIDTTILQPGAYGTDFSGHSIHPRDAALLETQPKVKAMLDAFGKGFEERARAGQLGNPEEVIEALVALVDLPADKRPLRMTVGKDVEGPVTAINQTCAQVQDQLLKAFGLR